MRKLMLLVTACLLLGILSGCSATNGMLMQSNSETTSPTGIAPTETVAPTEVWIEETAILEDVETQILLEDDSLRSDLVITAIDPNASFFGLDVSVNAVGADALIHWLLRQETIDMIASYQEPLYYPAEDIPISYAGVTPSNADAEPIQLRVSLPVYYSGLLDTLLPVFEEEYGYSVEVTAAERADIVVSAKLGEVDLMITEPCDDETMMEEGLYRQVYGFYETEIPFLYSHYVLCGPSADPAGAANSQSTADALQKIAKNQCMFISCGEHSEVGQIEHSLWPVGIVLAEEWYFDADIGIGPVLTIAEQMEGYTLTNKAAYLFFKLHKGII